jgi:hypothetical protein
MNRMYDDPMQLEDSMRLRITWADTYKLGSVELIGVAMHEPPVAFTASAHPISSQFLEPRALTSFEERALVELNAGETASVHTDKTGRFVVGALRAKEDCLQCHKSHKVGDLLGALTYRLKPVKDQMISRVAASLKR